MRMLNYLPWSIFNFLSRPPNPTRILLPWFSPTNQKNFIFLSKVLNHGNWISCCCCWNSFGFQQKVLLDRIWPFSCLLFSGLFQVKEIQRKLYSMFCIGIFWEWMNFWEWFQCLYVILTFTNVQKPSEYNFNNSFVSAIASVHQSVELCTRTSKVCCWLWTPKLYFCNGSDDICHEVFEGWSWIYFENWEISSVFMQKYFLTWRLSSSFLSE